VPDEVRKISKLARRICADCQLLALRAECERREASASVLTISGAVKQRLELTLADLRAMERVTVKAKDRDGAEQEFEGVRLWT